MTLIVLLRDYCRGWLSVVWQSAGRGGGDAAAGGPRQAVFGQPAIDVPSVHLHPHLLSPLHLPATHREGVFVHV